jgi:hypothetical protein
MILLLVDKPNFAGEAIAPPLNDRPLPFLLTAPSAIASQDAHHFTRTRCR